MSTLNERRRSSGTKEKLSSMFGAIRRVSLTRRGSSDSDLPTQGSIAQPVAKPPTMESIPQSMPSPSLDSSASARSSLQAPTQKLNSSSPASELPTTWTEWNYLYQNGFIDFDDPPPPPSDLRASEYATGTGQFRAPFPANEGKRQRAVDTVGPLLFNQGTPTKRRRSLQDPMDKGDLPPVPPPTYDEKSGEHIPPAYPAAAPSLSEATAELDRLTARQDGPMHPSLERLAQKAKARFGVSATTVSLMDRDQQRFLADSSCTFLTDSDTIPRENTACSHAMVKASTGTKDPLVILDFDQDWRFNKNGFGSYQKGFYAASPIMLPAPFGDDSGSYPAGIFCLLGEQPRTSFSAEERADLIAMADEASVEIQKYAAEQKQARKADLQQIKRQKWKKSKLVRSVAATHATNLDNIVEIETPPRTPDMSGLEISTLEDREDDALFVDAPRRPSLVESISSDGTVSDMLTTSSPPVFGSRRGNGRAGVFATTVDNLDPDVQSILDLSTQLVAESLEMDFAYLVAVDLASAATWSPDSNVKAPIALVSVHGLPIPPPHFSVDLHLQTSTTPEHTSLMFVNEQFDGSDGEFSTGLLVKVGQNETTGYLLGSYSEDSRRVLNSEDLVFVKSFAKDLRKHLL